MNKKNKILLTFFFIFLFLNAYKISKVIFITTHYNKAYFFGNFLIHLAFSSIIFIFLLKKKYISIFLYTIQFLYLISFLTYYYYYNNFLNPFIFLNLLTEGLSVTRQGAIPLFFTQLITLIDLPLFIFILYKSDKINNLLINIKIKNHSLKKLLYTFFLLMFIIQQSVYSIHISIFKYMRTPIKHERKLIIHYGLIFYNIYNIIEKKSEKYIIKSFDYGYKIKSKTVNKTNPNIIIIQIESMDSTIINKKYKGKYITPYLHNLTKNTIYYPYMLSYHKGGGTSDAEFSILNSVESLDTFPAFKLASYKFPNSFIKKLSNKYITYAFHNNEGNFFNRKISFKKIGFKRFYDMYQMHIKQLGWGIPDDKMFKYIIKNHSKKTSKPFLYYIITMTSHIPFTFVNKYKYYTNNNYNNIPEELTKYYFKSFSYVDNSIKYLIENFKKIKNTYIFIFGDHTPYMDYKYTKLKSIYKTKFYTTSAINIDNKKIEFVPLIIITPEQKKHIVKKFTASFLDIAPTVLSISKIKYEIKTYGENLLNFNKLKNKIPFKGKFYDRKFLYKKINTYLKNNS